MCQLHFNYKKEKTRMTKYAICLTWKKINSMYSTPRKDKITIDFLICSKLVPNWFFKYKKMFKPNVSDISWINEWINFYWALLGSRHYIVYEPYPIQSSQLYCLVYLMRLVQTQSHLGLNNVMQSCIYLN